MGKRNPKEAREVIRTLRSGSVTPKVARIITVGTEHLERLFQERVRRLLSDGFPKECLLLRGDWGCGKSHMRMIFKQHILSQNVPFIDDSIDGRAASLSHLHRCVPRWMHQLCIGHSRGLRNLLIQGILDENKAAEWCKSRRDAFGRHLLDALRGWQWGWFMALGHGYHTPDYSYQHWKARDLLCSAIELVSDLGKGGLILLIDETENISRQHDIRGRRKSYDTLGLFTAHPRILPVLFVTQRFFDQVAEDRERKRSEGGKLWTPSARSFVDKVLEYDTMSTPVLTDSLVRRVVSKVVNLYSYGYNMWIKVFPVDRVLTLWEQTPTKSIRLLIRTTVDQLDLIRLHGI